MMNADDVRRDMFDMEGITAYRIPQLGETPSDEMIAWLATCPVDWDGDDSGINIGGEVGGSGDWVYRRGDQWGVLTKSQAKLIAHGMSFDRARRTR